jgi:hypothetical protein
MKYYAIVGGALADITDKWRISSIISEKTA